MTQDTPKHQAPQPRWMPEVPRSTEQQLLQQRIEELEGQIKAYEQLLKNFPSYSNENSSSGSNRSWSATNCLPSNWINQRATSTIQLCLLPRDRAWSIVQTM